MRAWLLLAVWCVGPLQALAQAQQWPSRPLRVLVPSAAGGAGDIVARAVGQKLTEAWGQQVIVDNRNGIVGAEITARAAPDGYTIMFSTSALSIRESVYRQLPFNTLRDFAPVGQAVSQSNVLVAHPAVPVKSVQELIAYARVRPGELNYGSSGNASSNHLAGELFQLLTKVNFVHVPYKGNPQAFTDTIGGHIEVMFVTAGVARPYLPSGRVRALGIAGPRRLPTLAEVPTIMEAGLPDYKVICWHGMFFPAGTPADIVRRVNGELLKALATPEVKRYMADNDYFPTGTTPEELQTFVREDIVLQANFAKMVGIQPQ